jgi:hypothetical protein
LGQIAASQILLQNIIDELKVRFTAQEQRDIVHEVKKSIKNNGLYLGDRWWLGE